MSKFKVGDKVVRIKPVVHGTAKRTGIVDGCLYTVTAVGDSWIKLLESAETSFTFSARNFKLANSPTTWDVNEALRLRGLAVQAIQEYNTYLLQQPLLEAIEPPPPIK